MDKLQTLDKHIWGMIFDLCDPMDILNFGSVNKGTLKLCLNSPRSYAICTGDPYPLKEFDLKEKVHRIESVGSCLLALTESFQLVDVYTNEVLLDHVRDFACGEGTVVVCRQIKDEFRFEQYVWPQIKKPRAISEHFKSVAEHLYVEAKSHRLAGCINQTQVVLWDFELPEVVRPLQLGASVTGVVFDAKARLVAREGFIQPRCQVWDGKSWYQEDLSHCDPISELWCSYGEATVVATDTALQLIEVEKKQSKKKPLQPESKRIKMEPRKVELLKLSNLQYIQAVKSLFSGRAFLSLDDSGELILWFSATEKRVLCKQDPYMKFIADQLTVGTDAQGHPVIAYVMNDKTVRIFSVS